MSDSDRLDNFERRLEEMAKELEYRAKEFGERMEEMGDRIAESLDARHSSTSDEARERRLRRKQSDSLFWGLTFIAVGVVWMSRNMGWFEWDIPLWPVLLIALGIYFLFRGSQH